MPVTFGAIRWDAWYGNDPSYNSFQTAATFTDTTPIDWRSRAPAHANLLTTPIIWADSQATFDNEINVAANGGLDYWVYLTYASPDAGHMNQGLAYHLASSIKDRMKFALMRQANDLGTTGNFTTQINAVVAYMQNSAYMMSGGRPLLYIYFNPTDIANFWGGSSANFVAMITALRAAAITAGLQNPYIISVSGDTSSNVTYGTDAVSNYIGPIPSTPGAPYTVLDAAARDYWSTGLTASAIVPICMVGWDPRPRRQHPESWANSSGTTWIVGPTVSELAAHLMAARLYITIHQARCPAKTVLVYAWSENDEGGVMPGPTVGDPGGTLSQAFGLAKL